MQQTMFTTTPISRIRTNASWLEMPSTGCVADVSACPTPDFHGNALRTIPGRLGETT